MALRINPAPTFKTKVGIPVPGQEAPEVIVCEFGHMTREQFAAFGAPDVAKARGDVDTLMALLRGWEGVDAPFGREAVEQLVANYHGAAFAIADAFAQELTKARLGN